MKTKGLNSISTVVQRTAASFCSGRMRRASSILCGSCGGRIEAAKSGEHAVDGPHTARTVLLPSWRRGEVPQPTAWAGNAWEGKDLCKALSGSGWFDFEHGLSC